MSEFDDAMREGFQAVLEVTSAPTLTVGVVTRPCVSTPIAQSREMRDAGYWPKFHCIAELLRSDALALGLADRTLVLYRDAAAERVEIALKVIGIEDDPADPCIKVTLKEEPADARV